MLKKKNAALSSSALERPSANCESSLMVFSRPLTSMFCGFCTRSITRGGVNRYRFLSHFSPKHRLRAQQSNRVSQAPNVREAGTLRRARASCLGAYRDAAAACGTPYFWISSVTASLLLAAASLKTHQLIIEWISATEAKRDPLLLPQIAFEVTVGLLLLWKRSEGIRLLTLVTFAAFAYVALYRAISGASSCGCFGKLSVNPFSTAIADLVIVAAFALVTPRGCPRRARRQGFLLAVIAITGFLIIWFNQDRVRTHVLTTVAPNGSISRPGAIVLLAPNEWVGSKLPILTHIDVGTQLESGSWKVLLYHYDCSICRDVLHTFERDARDATLATDKSHIALIEIPPYAPPGQSPVSLPSACVLGRLSADHQWAVKTPVIIFLANGRVTSASQGAR
jgi:hypothetical protein